MSEKRKKPRRILKPGDKIGQVTLIRQLPLMTEDHSRRWECVCQCGNKTIKSRNVLMDKDVISARCNDCYVKSQRAYELLRRMLDR